MGLWRGAILTGAVTVYVLGAFATAQAQQYYEPPAAQPTGCPQKGFLNVGTADGETLNGTPQSDVIFGRMGSDTLNGADGDDCLYGEEGDDELSGGSDDDIVGGGSGDDEISGGGGSDTLVGNSGDDEINGGNSGDSISAGTGDDIVFARDGVRDTINCGPGRDRVTADRSDSVARNCERVARR
jgi:Ca2+-binding RTX toxin-like protein